MLKSAGGKKKVKVGATFSQIIDKTGKMGGKS